MKRRLLPALLATAGLLLGWGCGSGVGGATSSVACPGPACNCEGGTCECRAEETCSWSASETPSCTDGDSCSFKCELDSVCSGSCGDSCSVECAGGSFCEITSGASGSINCTDATCSVELGESGSISCQDATCTVTCTSTCSVSCTGSECELSCPGDSEPREVDGSASCG